MSPYDKVKHVMIPRRPICQAQQGWIDAVADLAAAFSAAAAGEGDEDGSGVDSFFLQTAGDIIWTASGGTPCWSKLDVAAYLKGHREMSPQQQGLAALTMMEFYSWLVEHGRLRYRDAIVVLQQLEHHAAESLAALGYQLRFGRNRAERRAQRSARWQN